eukprot:1616784-Pleurochrysis_carterae.AAC.1
MVRLTIPMSERRSEDHLLPSSMLVRPVRGGWPYSNNSPRRLAVAYGGGFNPLENWTVGIDVVKALTQATLSDAELYSGQREGFKEYDQTTREELVCKLKLALQGGRKSEHLWREANTEFLKDYGLTQLCCEPFIFTLKRSGCCFF